MRLLTSLVLSLQNAKNKSINKFVFRPEMSWYPCHEWQRRDKVLDLKTSYSGNLNRFTKMISNVKPEWGLCHLPLLFSSHSTRLLAATTLRNVLGTKNLSQILGRTLSDFLLSVSSLLISTLQLKENPSPTPCRVSWMRPRILGEWRWSE